MVRGDIRPASVRILCRLCLTTEAAMKALDGERSRHSFRAVIRRHLTYLGPRTGIWGHVRYTPGLVDGDACELECEAWSTAPWTQAMSDWVDGQVLARV